MKKIIFICVNFNNWEYTKKFCESLLCQRGSGSDFLVRCSIVDNSSNKQDSENLRPFSSEYDWIDYVVAPRNLGYFGGLNYGLDRVENDEGDYLVICNNDVTVDSEFCSRLSSKKYAINIFAVCPDVITADGLHQNPHLSNKIGWFRRFKLDLYFSHYYVARLLAMILRLVRPVKTSPPQPTVGCEIHMGIGAIYVLTSEFLKRFKKLNFPHFLYGEEAYFSDQIHSAGGILWFDPDLRVLHAESASLSKVPKRIAYEYARSGYRSYRRML